ncbi:MAG: type II toxin-antitoxin system HipA family toxin [Clostridia bacterium]|nr:type II toxin-antitoxin system HipA family toxin [Clostridia bacterium]
MAVAKKIYVYENWMASEPSLMGCLYAESLRGKEITSFEYSPSWLSNHPGLLALDPDLQLFSGRQFTPLDKPMFGILSDSCPDRWGRLLMDRREEILAKQENRKPRNLLETDYLLGVHDEARMGALRFSLQEGGPFLSCDSDMAAPPWTTLRNLEAASLAFEKDPDTLSNRWLQMLLAPGSSLGGARPKASVKAPDNSLWIAKFPSKHDQYDSGAWEQVTHELAKMCRLNVPESRLERFSDAGSTFLVKRFDRQADRRVHFSSALALLGEKDGDSTNSSYLELVQFLTSYGASARSDLKELWRRIVFSMAVSNTDDHLRNHGFLLSPNGWRLSPMFDVNPNPKGNFLSLCVTLNESRIDPDLAIEAASFFGLKKDKAAEEAKHILSVIGRSWRPIAESCGISGDSQEAVAPAFSICSER